MHPFDPTWLLEPHTEPTTTVVLHGALARQFGRRHELAVTTASEAAHALCALHPEFKSAFQDHYYRVIRGSVAKGLPLSEGMLNMKIGRAGEIHFVPTAKGSKRGGIGKIILGAIIIVVAIVLAIPSGGSSLGGAAAFLGSLGITASGLAFFGASLVLAGISQMLSPQPSNNGLTATDPRASFGLGGQTNTADQGSAVPVVYGRQRVGSVVGSFGYTTEDYGGQLYPMNFDVGFLGFTNPNVQSTGAVGSGGGGKGGGGGSGGAREAPNTLRSNAVVRIIDILSEGPIGGLVNGAKSIFFNNTPLQASDGTYNFQGVTWEVRLGYPDQVPVPGYPAAEEVQGPNLGLPFLVKKLTPKTVTVNSSTATAVSVVIRIPTLLTQDPKTGDLKAGPSLSFIFEVRPAGGVWTTVAEGFFHGHKCVSPYQRSYRFSLPGAFDSVRASSWDIRMTRLSDDDTSINNHSDVYFDALTMITDHRLSYPNTAYIALTIDASAFGTQIPTRQYEIDGVVCQVPLNYDPIAHVYATSGPGTSMGTWDGASWKPAVTNNPAWCLYDMLSNNRYGMSLPARVLVATRYDLFPISQYCDGMVPSGFKDPQGNDILELRFALNVLMSTQDDAYRVIQSLVSSFRGMAYWGAGRVVVTADMPVQPSAIMNQANVIEGEFVYEGTPLKSRHTVARVAWQDPTNSYTTTIEVVEDFDAVVTLGQVPSDIHGFGVTSRGLARRLGRWLLETEKHQNESMSCSTGMEHLRVRPGDVAYVSDPAFVGYATGGRAQDGCTTTVIGLDRVVSTTPEYTYTLSITLPDGTVESKTVASVATDVNGRTVASLASPLSQVPIANASWSVQSVGPTGPHGPDGLLAVSSRQFRILSLMEPSRGQFQLIAINHDPNKYARVEYGIQFDPTPYSVLGTLLATPIPPPSNVYAQDFITGVGTTTLVRATVSCSPAIDPRVIGQQFRAVGPESRIVSGNGATMDFDDLQIGTYVFGARSAGRDGRASVWVDSPSVVVDGLADAPDVILGLVAQGGAMQVNLTWNRGTARDVLHFELWRAGAPANGAHPFQFAGYVPVGDPYSNGASLLATVDGTTYHDSGDVLGPDKAWAYWVRAINTTLVAGAFVGPVTALTTYYLTDNLQDGIRNTAIFANALLGGAPGLAPDLTIAGTHERQLLFNTTDKNLYTWDSTHQVWVLFIPVVPDSTGKLTASQIGALNQSSISGTLTADQTKALLAGIQAGTITSDKIASVTGDKVTGNISNATVQAGQVYDVDPVTGASVQGVNTGRLLGTFAGSKILGALPNATITGTSIYDVDPVTGNVVAGVNAARLLGKLDGTKLSTVPASLIQDTDPLTLQQVTGLRAARIAGQLVASQISAGSIDATKLTVGSPDNVIGNSCFTVSADGWRFDGCTATPVLGSSYEANYAPTADGAVLFASPVIAPGAYRDVFYNAGVQSATVAFDAPFPCVQGECWEAQICFLPVSGTVELYLVLALNDGTIAPGLGTGPQTVAVPVNGKTLPLWTRIGRSGVAPANTVAVGILVRLTNSSSSPAAASAFLTRAGLGRTVPNAAQLLGWGPGGVTSIAAGQLRSNSVVARTIAANVITSDKMVANSITARELSIGGGANVIWNASPLLAGDGWSGKGVGVAVNPASVVSPAWALPDGNGTFSATLASGAVLDAVWTPDVVGGQSVVPGEWWEAQALLMPLYAAGQLFLQWLKADGTSAGVTPGSISVSDYAVNPPGSGQQQTLSAYRQVFAIGPAPVLATSVRLVVRLANSGASGLCTMYFARALLGLTVSGATQPSSFAPGGLTTVSGGVIQTGAVLARTIAAGQVTADKAAFGTSNNVVWNSCCTGTADGWNVTYSGVSATVAAAADSDALKLAAFGTGLLRNTADLGGLYVQASWCPQDGFPGVPCQAGQRWEAQALVLAGGCTAGVQLDWYNGAGAFIATSPGSTTGPADTSTGARTIDKYVQVTVLGTAPAGALSVVLGIRMTAAPVGQVIAFTQTLLAQTGAYASQVSVWAPGGVTQVSGGAIKTNTVDARTIKANQIGARELAVGNSANLISNSCCAVSAEGWSAYGSAGGAGPVTSCASVYTSYLTPDGCGGIATTLTAGAYIDISWQPQTCVAGETYEAQILALPTASQAVLYLTFQDPTGALVGYSAPSATLAQQPQPAAALQGSLAPFGLLQLIAVAPPGAAQVVFNMRLTCSQPGLAGFTIFTRAALGRTFAGATQISPWSPGGITSIGGGVIRTSAIVTRNLAAGSATIEKLAVASAANAIWNSCCSSSSSGWVNYSSGSGSLGSVTGDLPTLGFYALAGLGAGVLSATSLATGDGLYAAWDPDSTYGLPALPGQWWEASGYLGALRCFAQVRIEFLSPSGTRISDAPGSRVAGPSGGQDLAAYGFSWSKAQVPVGASRVRLVIDGRNDNGTDIGGGTAGNNPYVFFTKTLLGPSTPVTIAQGAQPQPWQPGGITQVVGGMIKTGAVVARTISAGAIDATKLSVGSATNVIWNGCCSQSGTGWMVGVTASPAGDPFTLPGFGTGIFTLASLITDDYRDVSWAPNNGADGTTYKYDGVNPTPWGAAVPCTPGSLMEAQVRVCTNRCSVELYLVFLGIDAVSNKMVLLSAQSTGAQSFPMPSQGRSLLNYTQLSVRGTVPANATNCTLLMRVANSATSRAVFGVFSGQLPFLYFTQAGLGTCLPNVPAPMPWAPGGVTVLDGGTLKAASIQALSMGVGSVTAGSILAGSVTTAALAAQSVTAEKATFGTVSNLIWNSCADQGYEGWQPNVFGSYMPVLGSSNLVLNAASLANPQYALSGYGSMFSQYTDAGLISDSQGFYWDWKPNGSLYGVPCNISTTYGAAALLLCGNDAVAGIQLFFFDYSGNVVAATPISTEVTNNATQYGGVAESQYQRVTITAVSPATAVFVMMRVRIRGVTAGSTRPFCAWTKAQLAALPPGGRIGEWVPGGVTTISGGMIKTGSLNANRIVANSITAGQIAAQTITGTQIQAGSVDANRLTANSITSGLIQANAIVAGQISAGAVGATQIAANAIRSTHLAADFALINSAQIGTATINTANILNLNVPTTWLNMGSVSDTADSHCGAFLGGARTLSTGVNAAPGGSAILIFMRAYFDSDTDDTIPVSNGGFNGAEGGSGEAGS